MFLSITRSESIYLQSLARVRCGFLPYTKQGTALTAQETVFDLTLRASEVVIRRELNLADGFEGSELWNHRSGLSSEWVIFCDSSWLIDWLIDSSCDHALLPKGQRVNKNSHDGQYLCLYSLFLTDATPWSSHWTKCSVFKHCGVEQLGRFSCKVTPVTPPSTDLTILAPLQPALITASLVNIFTLKLSGTRDKRRDNRPAWYTEYAENTYGTPMRTDGRFGISLKWRSPIKDGI
jgi:hypothetical protein